MNSQKILRDTIACAYYYKVELGRAILFPFFLMIVIELFRPTESSLIYSVLTAFITLFAYINLAVVTHRIILLGPASVFKWGVYFPAARELRFFIYSIGVGVIAASAAVFLLIPYAGKVLMIVLSSYLLSRFSLVFPAIATDKKWTLLDSWEASKEHQLTIIVVVLIFPFLLGIPELLLSYIPYTEILINGISLLTTILTVASLSSLSRVMNEQN